MANRQEKVFSEDSKYHIKVIESMQAKIDRLYAELAQARKDIERKNAALTELRGYNRANNDLEAYLDEVAKWGLEIVPEHPSAESYGIFPDALTYPLQGERTA